MVGMINQSNASHLGETVVVGDGQEGRFGE